MTKEQFILNPAGSLPRAMHSFDAYCVRQFIRKAIDELIARTQETDVVERPLTFMEVAKARKARPVRPDVNTPKWGKVYKELRQLLKIADETDSPVEYCGVKLAGDDIDDILETYFE